MAVADGAEGETVELRPEARLGAALRAARECQGISLRALARRLYRSHSNLVEYERGHRLAPPDVVQGYEVELGLAAGTLVAHHEQARLELHRADRSRRQTYSPRPPPDTPHQLPRDVAHFTGRDAELRKLRAAVAEARAGAVVTLAIAGTAGVGKTALAVHLAHELTSDFPDVQLYVNLHGYDAHQGLSPPDVLDRFLRALGVADEVLPTDVEEQAALYRGRLAGKRALVILDNALCAAQVRPLLPGSPTCLVLITSRDALSGLVARDGARLLTLDVLSPVEAVELLAHIAGADRVEHEPQAAGELVRFCGYLPLAVSIAGARLARRLTLSIATLAERLADEQHRLGELMAGDAEVRASFAFSYQELPPVAACMCRRLGLIAGPDFGPEVAATLTDVTPEEAEELLEALVDTHLLEAAPVPGRYRFHDLLRLYARECVQAEETERDRENAVRRVLSWYLESADAADRSIARSFPRLPREPSRSGPKVVFTAHAQALDWLKMERPSLVAAIHQAADYGLQEIACQLPDVLWFFFYRGGHWADWENVYQVGLTAARAAHNRQAEASMLIGLGELYVSLRRYDKAFGFYQQCLGVFREIEDRGAEAWMRLGLGGVYAGLRRYDEALDLYEQCLGVFREIGVLWGKSWTLYRLGEAYVDLRRYDDALDSCREALGIFREVGDRWGESWTLYRLGGVYTGLRRYDDALDSYRQGLWLFREVGDRWGESWTLYRLGGVYTGLRRYDDASDFYRQGLMICREAGDRWGESLTLYRLGIALQHAQGIKAAQPCWQEALTIFAELGAPHANDIRALLEEQGDLGESHS